MALVFPGSPEVFASFEKPVIMLIREDFPTFDRPIKPNSGILVFGQSLSVGLLFTKVAERIIIGFICFLYFNALYLAGSVIDTQIGFGMVNVLDPQINSQIPIMGNFYNLLITLIFLAVNGHHLIIRGLVYSFELLPIGFTYTLGEDFIIKVIAIMTETFVLAFRFSAPILAIIFLTNVLLGILARTMPQMNVFIVGLPLKLIVGIVTAIITLQFLMPFSEKLFDKMFGALFEIIQILARG